MSRCSPSKYCFGGLLLLAVWPLSADMPLELHGELIQGALIRGQTTGGAAVFFDGRSLRVSEDGLFAFGLGRNAAPRSLLRVRSAQGETLNKVLEIADREYAVQRIDHLEHRKVHPEPQDIARAIKENKQIALTRTRDDARTDFFGGFDWPVHGVITGVYGSGRILNGQPRSPHYGIDIACRSGAPVRAPAPGVVTFVHQDMFFSGATLVIDHGHGVSSTFLHLSEMPVAEGQRVERGQVIARVGVSGRVTGAHLDWRINWFKQRLDPALLVGQMPPPSPDCAARTISPAAS